MTDAAPGKLTRQELYDRIRETSKDAYILAEMKRLGFWPRDNDKPSPAEEAITRQAELEKELRDLTEKLRVVEDPEAALKAMRKQRMLDSRLAQEENRQRRNQERLEKSLAWHERQGTHIDYLGDGVSAGLADTSSDVGRLETHSLPVMHTAADLAGAMGIGVRELRFLSYNRDVSRTSHYRQFELPKKTGGTRLISAPMPRLKRAQYWILENVLAKLATHAAAHGFVPGRSIVSNATPHVGAAVVVNLDLKDFFPTISYRRVKGLLRSLGYSEQLATVIALLCTEADNDVVEMHGERFYVARGERRLPQGSPASPAISNIICRRLDRRLEGMALKLGYRYTRYADDMTFSAAAREHAAHVNKLLWRARSIIRDEGFSEHEDKTRIMRKGARQEVTGIVVNDKPSLDRKTLRRFRAALHKLEKDGPEGVEWNGSANVLESMTGYANYLAMVDREKGAALQKRLTRSRKRHKTPKPTAPAELSNRFLRRAAARGENPRPDWWQAAEPPKPVLEKTQEQIKAEKRELRRAQSAAMRPPARAARETGRRRDDLSHIDTRTGRFKPTLARAVTILLLLLGASLIFGDYRLLVFGTCWVGVNQVAWRLHWTWRALIAMVLFGGILELYGRYLV